MNTTPLRLEKPPTARGLTVGIDLGTSNSLVAILRNGQVTVLENAIGERLTPSVVSMDENQRLLVGKAAQARAVTHPERTARLFKRDMGTDRRIPFNGREMLAQELSAMVLKSLKDDAEAVLGETVDEAVITVPAYFGDRQRQATRDAGAIAGLRVRRIINEPTAAAMAYGLHHLDKEARAVVLDLGGGTFDVTVLEIIEGVIEIQASAGDARLGGEDFAEVLAEYCAASVQTDSGVDPKQDRQAFAQIRDAAEAAKRRLSRQLHAQVVVPRLPLNGREMSLDLRITRAEAETLWEPLLDRLRTPILRALSDARVRPEAIDEVLLVGGATRMPCVMNLAANVFGKAPREALEVDEAVAVGAAIQAALMQDDEAVEDLVVTDVAPFSMGIATATMMGRQAVTGLFSPILERGTTIPASRSESFFTMQDGQTAITVQVYQGEHSMCKDNTLLGEYTVKSLPKRSAGEVKIDVRFTYDLNGILEVEMSAGEGRVEHLVLEQTPGRLSTKQLETARKRMARLKFHPRESLPNRTLLARGDAAFTSLTGEGRALLGEALAGFRAALETQNDELIAVSKAHLESWIANSR